jgi:hypothetical protein
MLTIIIQNKYSKGHVFDTDHCLFKLKISKISIIIMTTKHLKRGAAPVPEVLYISNKLQIVAICNICFEIDSIMVLPPSCHDEETYLQQ